MLFLSRHYLEKKSFVTIFLIINSIKRIEIDTLIFYVNNMNSYGFC